MKTFRFVQIWAAVSILTTINSPVHAQPSAPDESIAITARPERDSITLRWAPLRFQTWRYGNDFGYTIERYLIARDDAVLDKPEKIVLIAALKALPEEQWEGIVDQTPYAAIAAQALYGDRFEIDLKDSDLFAIANKVQENEQRFHFALFSADMSAAVARASGLLFTDTTVRPNEKYLYRIHLTGIDSLRGSIFISPSEPYWLPPPQNLKIEFKDKHVSLRWDRTPSTPYTAYVVERSEDGTVFRKMSESPITTLVPDETETNLYEYATDSIPDFHKTYYYRIIGITPFGDQGPASPVISGRGIPMVEQVPYIVAAISHDNQKIVLQWDFPEDNNNAIKGFAVERAASPSSPFLKLTEGLLPIESRSFVDSAPVRVNYYRVNALGHDNEWYSSHVYFSQLIDSIPPMTPSKVTAIVNDEGVVALSWDANTDRDIYGYRVYKANHSSEEVAQLTSEPITVPVFFDTMDLNILNEAVYYSVMAIDASQNHSPLSSRLRVALPDKVRPQPPVLLPVSSTDDGVVLTWLPGGSEDIVEYRVYRKHNDARWMLLKVLSAGTDSVMSFVDNKPGTEYAYSYTVISVDDAGLESDPSQPVLGVVKANRLKPSIQWKKARLTGKENEVGLSWTYDFANVDVFTIFRSENAGPFILHRTVAADTRAYEERIVPGGTYRYRIMATFHDGNKSALSDQLLFKY